MQNETRKDDATNNAALQAKAQVESIVEMVAALNCDYARLEELRDEKQYCESENLVFEYSEELAKLEDAACDCTSEDDARERILEDALSVEVRSDWESSASEFTPSEFRILLCTGGPHVELVGDLDCGTPSRVRVIYKDWGTRGEYFPDSSEREAIETYCAQFYFGE
jgi:hypothetical protein